jgi:hypothetical protein
VTIVSRSLGSRFDGPGNGTGDSAKVVDYAVGKGIAWFNSAGNSGSYGALADGTKVGGYFRGTWADRNGTGFLDFNGAGGTPTDYLRIGCGYVFGVRWNDWSGNATDYDAIITDATGQTTVAASTDVQAQTGQPLEGTTSFVDWESTCSPNAVYYLWIYKTQEGNGTSGDIIEVMANNFVYGFPSLPYSATQPFTDTANGGAAGVGAVDPVAGTTIADYSAQGPSNDGRIKPDFSAGANMSSYIYRARGGFPGTSAATPAAAGAAALIRQQHPEFTPAQLMSFITTRELVERGAAGADNVFGRGELVLASPIATFTATPTPTISGTAKVGSTLTAAPGTWSPAPVTLAYQWRRGGTAITGATAQTYKAVAADVGAALTVTVSGAKSGYTSVSKTSAATPAVAAGSLTAAVPTISGQPLVGQKLTASAGSWSPAPVSFTYQWRRGTTAISGATAAAYTVATADTGATLNVVVRGSKSGYNSASRASASTAAVTAPKTLTAVPTPTVSGSAKVGSTLTASAGTWSPSPVALAYQWKRSGATIPGATASTYKAVTADAGKTLSVTVTGSKTGYTTASRTSAATATVTGGVLTTAVPTISGTASVGSTLTASPGTWGPSPVTLTYQWRRAGAVISGATAATYTAVAADAGAALSVSVKGTKTGFTSVTKTSAPTAAVTSAPACTSQLLKNRQFESGAQNWSQSSAGIILTDGAYEHAGVGYAWLGGLGIAGSQTVTQTVTIPAGCKASLAYWADIRTDETEAVAYDFFEVVANGTVVQRYSNLDAGTTYARRSVSLNAYSGTTLTLSFRVREDSNTLTSVFVDDTYLVLSK